MKKSPLSYGDCLEWIALNDDTEWLKDENPMISVTGSMVCHLFGVSQKKFIVDLRGTLEELGI